VKKYRFVSLVAVAGVLAATLLVLGCGKSSSPTSPMGGGGGGGSGGNTPFDSGSLTAPASFSHAFPTAGSVGYHCNFHSSMGMVGTVNVSSGATDSIVTVTASGVSFTPSTVTIKPGGVVHWNITGGTHTVTSG
jgi:plastocyanin